MTMGTPSPYCEQRSSPVDEEIDRLIMHFARRTDLEKGGWVIGDTRPS